MIIFTLKNSIKLENGKALSMFRKNVDSIFRAVSSVPIFLSKYYVRVWFKNKKYELPAQVNLLSTDLLSDLKSKNISYEDFNP